MPAEQFRFRSPCRRTRATVPALAPWLFAGLTIACVDPGAHVQLGGRAATPSAPVNSLASLVGESSAPIETPTLPTAMTAPIAQAGSGGRF